MDRRQQFYTVGDVGRSERLEQEPWCPVAATAGLIAGKWKPTILLNLKTGPVRFNELRRLIPGITQRSLTMQLRALESDGLVDRRDHNTNPPHVDYKLSERAWGLGPILDAMAEWGELHGH